jgi:hypothetical protein
MNIHGQRFQFARFQPLQHDERAGGNSRERLRASLSGDFADLIFKNDEMNGPGP